VLLAIRIGAMSAVGEAIAINAASSPINPAIEKPTG
jgi:hypothetical protein